MIKRVATSIITVTVLFATACSTTTDDEISDESGREQLLQEILADPELGVSRGLAECFIDYVVDNSPLDFEQWNTLGDGYPVSAEALDGLSEEEMEDLISVVAIGVEDCGLFDEEYEDADGGDYSPPVVSGEFNFELLTEHPFDCLNQELDVFVNVFGIYVISHSSVPTEYVEHSANVLAEFMDNDADGVMDDPEVHRFLVENNFVVPVWTEALREEVFPSLRGTFCEDNLGWAASMYYGHDDWAFGGIKQAGTWDTNLEEIWHVVSVGWYNTYPEYFGDRTGSRLADAVDAARGGHFLTVPNSYPEGAWYTYDDYTCDYSCQMHEYFYWILMANIDALDPAYTSKCADSKDEWYVCTKDELQQIDPLAYDLLNNQGFKLPTRIPSGSYRGPSGRETSPTVEEPAAEVAEQKCEASSDSDESGTEFQKGSKGVGDPYFPGLGNGGYDVDRYLIDVTWQPGDGYLDGWTTIEAKTTENLSSFNVDLNANMAVSEVIVNGEEACFIREGTEVTVVPATNLPLGSEFEARFAYAGFPGLVPAEYAPIAGGWYHEPFITEDNMVQRNNIMYVVGEPSSSMAWHPVNDHPRDRAQFRIEMAVDNGPNYVYFPDWEVVTNGYLISKEETTNTQNLPVTTWIYETRYPQAPYLTVLAYGPFTESDEEDLDDVTLRHWAQNADTLPGGSFAHAKETLGIDYGPMFEVFTDLFGPYLYDTYGYLALSDSLGFALETQTLSIFGYGTWTQPFIHVHELAHQWFGNYITVDNWSEIWLNEGFATYSEYLFEEAVAPEYDIFLEMRSLVTTGEAYGWFAVLPGDPGPENLFAPAVYFRGALTLHALRMTIGDDAFFASVRKYVDDFGGKSVTTADFVQVVESVSGADLEDFFDSWLFGTPMPDLPCEGYSPCVQ